jgi:uncharacterized protein YjbI with pentapeptide repeats/membrane protein implicated in regulation of membrane protease activity
VVDMSEERDAATTKQNKLRPWRPTNRQALWAIGLVVALVTMTLLVAGRYPDIWQALSRERAMLIGIGVALVAVIVLLAIGGASLGWTGFADKTLWEWLQLLGALAIPVVLAIAGFWFTSQQEARQQRIEDQRAQQAQEIENQRAEAERELAEQRAQDEALQAYLDQMGSLLLERDLRASEEDSEVRSVARARTLTVLGRLDPSRKTALMQFLVEAELVQRVERGRGPIITLTGANLSNLKGDLVFPVGNQVGTTQSTANLKNAILDNANLSDADLPGVDLSHAVLRFADLTGANLELADLTGAYLWGSNLSSAYLGIANLSDANLFEANLSEANLSVADLSGASLGDADLSDANLSDADLSGADLSGADLTGADGVSKEMLKQQAKSLRVATMPDGTVFSDRYATSEFEPALSFSLSEEWQSAAAQERPDRISISGPELGELIFTNPRHVFDPSAPSEPKELPAPENATEWVSWFQKHPNLDTSKPVPVRVGGASGMRIDVTVTSTPENYPKNFCGGQPCVPLYALSGENGIIGYEGYKDRFVIVDVGNETVLIDAAAPTDNFDEFLPKAQKVLDSVEWKGG